MKQKENHFDAIVVGSGISGGWAAKELCEKGLKTLVLERGRNVDHLKDYPTMNKAPWEFENRGLYSKEIKENYYVQSRTYAFNLGNKPFFVNDKDNPYTTPEDKQFNWLRGYQVGGRSITWGRQSYRLSDIDFEANAKDGIAIDWPIRYKDIAPWYDYVEQFVGISGKKEGLAQLPDGKFLPPMEMFCVEKKVKKALEANWDDRIMTIGRVANLTQNHNGRTKCQFRNLCDRGCPFSAYFSSLSATLPAARATGNLTLRPDSIVESVIYDKETGKASGVRVIDAQTNETKEFFAKVVFLCASTLGSTWILLNSKSNEFPNGLGNSGGTLGKYLMDHHFNVYSKAEFEGYEDQYHYGYRPNGIFVPRFRNIKEKHPDFIRGYGMQGGGNRAGWGYGNRKAGFGGQFKDELMKPGPWEMTLQGFGECLPYEDNQVRLNHEVTDKWGLPTLHISCEFKENEYAMREDMKKTTYEILEAAGGKNIETRDVDDVPGHAIHEMGTARMGRDPKTSVLNGFNQMHDVPNVFVTDGSAMTSSASQNPSLTYMALTARAVDYAVNQLKKRNI
ncbi:MAG: GMC family oxidoreductase [Fulvivirga sp.]|nr:GMC family oxidoreductase [Fulvivirga sp.]